MAKNLNIVDMPRNDLDAAERYYKSLKRPLTQDEWIVIWRSQDDPVGLEILAEDWDIDMTPEKTYLDELLSYRPS